MMLHGGGTPAREDLISDRDGRDRCSTPARSAGDERALRVAWADLELHEWHARAGKERADELARHAIHLEQLHPDRLLGHSVRRVVDRFLPDRSLRRRIARWTYRAAVIFASEGARAVVRRGGVRLMRKWDSVWQARALRPRRRHSPPPPHDEMRTTTGACTSVGRVDPAHGGPGGRRARIAMLTSSLGNYFFDEIRDLIATGMRELGHEVLIDTERRGLRDDVDYNVVVAPHEFFLLGKGPELLRSRWPENVIIVSTEQPSTPWFAASREALERARVVWDVDYGTSRLLRDRGIACDYLPLGYAPGHAAFSLVEDLPRHYGTCFLGDDILRSPAVGAPLTGRPLDLLFVGGLSRRREAFFSLAAPALTDYRSYLHLFDTSTPQLRGKTTYIDGPTVNGLSQRSKVLLNIHQGKDVYFEWQRIVLQGLWHRTLVISEPCSVAPPFRPGIDYVECELDQMPQVLRYYLDDPRGRSEAQEIADSGHETLVSECRLAHFLRILLDGQETPGSVLAHFDNRRRTGAGPRSPLHRPDALQRRAG